jgi:hypothetical protein
MRNIFLAVCVIISGVAVAQSGGQLEKKATIEVSNISLEKALSILSLSYDVEFSYSDSVVPVDSIVSLSINQENISAVLDKLLSLYQLSYKIVNKRVILKRSSVPLVQVVRGYVVDELNTTLPGVVITISNGIQVFTIVTDEEGKFRANNVPVGRVTITVKVMGYQQKDYSNVLVSTGKELVLTITLVEAVSTMQEVVITALKSEGVPGNGMAVTSGHSFDVEETKRYAGSVGDPARMASAYSGVTGASDENNALIVRGNSPRGVLWRVEGMEIPNPNHFATEGSSSGIVSVLSANVIDRCDFLTGAFPALYGNALSAVFDINLRNGNNERNEYSLQAGSLGVEASVEGPFSKQHNASYLLNYRYSSLSILNKLGAELNVVDQYRDYQDMSFKIHIPTQRLGRFSLFGIGGKSRLHKNDSLILDQNFSDMGVLGINHDHRLGDNMAMTTAVSVSGTRIGKNYTVTDELPEETSLIQEDYTKFYTRLALSAKRKLSNTYFLEGGIVQSWLKYDFFLRNFDPFRDSYREIIEFHVSNDNGNNNTAITQSFLCARHYITTTLSGFYGLHFLRFALTKDKSLEPRIGLQWRVASGNILSLAYGKHSRVENLQYYLARKHQTGGNEVQVNKDLKFTRAHHLVASYEHTFSKLHAFKVEIYHQRLYNAPVESNPASLYTAINEDTGFTSDTLLNNGNGINYGIEASAQRSLFNNFYYMVNGSFYRSTFSIDHKERNTAYSGNYSIHALAGKELKFRNERHSVGANMKITVAGGRRYIPIDLAKSIEAGKQIYDYGNAFERQLPHYFRGDIQFMYKYNHARYSVEWRLDIQNFTNHNNASFYFYDVDNQSIKLRKQAGILPLLSLRVEF